MRIKKRKKSRRIRYANPMNAIARYNKHPHITFYQDVGLVRIIKMAGRSICKTACIESCVERSMTRYSGLADGKRYEMNWMEDGTWHVWWQDTWEEPRVFADLEDAINGVNEW